MKPTASGGKRVHSLHVVRRRKSQLQSFFLLVTHAKDHEETKVTDWRKRSAAGCG